MEADAVVLYVDEGVKSETPGLATPSFTNPFPRTTFVLGAEETAAN